jgi:hypothetical protein
MLSRLEAITAVTVIITDGVEDADIITVGDTIITDSNPKEAASVGGLFHFGYPLAPPPRLADCAQRTTADGIHSNERRQPKTGSPLRG